jgi:hypothetical protein
MLFDMKHFTEIKPDPFALENLIAWLEAQPPERTYVFTSNHNCLLAQYFTAMGFEDVWVYGYGEWHHEFFHSSKDYEKYPKEWDGIANSYDATFGDALIRARKLQSSHACVQ